MPASLNLAALGRRIRDIRVARRLTLEAAVTRTDFTVSWLSKLENGQLSPSLEGLVRLAEAFGVGVETLVTGLSVPPNHVVVRAGNGQVKNHPPRPASKKSTGNGHVEHLADAWQNPAMQPVIIHLAGNTSHRTSDDGQRFLLVLDGGVAFQYGEDAIRLEKGDSVYFNAGVEHSLTGTGKGTTRVLSVITNAVTPSGPTRTWTTKRRPNRRVPAAKTQGRASGQT